MSEYSGGSGGSNGIGSVETTVLISLMALCLIFFFYDKIELFFLGVWRDVRVIEYMIFAWIPDWVPFFGDYGQLSDSLKDLPRGEIVKVKSAVEFHYSWPYALVSIVVMVILSLKLMKMSVAATQKFDMESLLERWYTYSKSSTIKDWDKIIGINKNDDKINEHPEKESHKFNGTNHLMADPASPWSLATETHLFLEGLPKGRQIYDPETGVFDTILAREVCDAQLGAPFSGYSSMKTIEKYCFNYIANIVSARTRTSLPDTKKRFIEIMEMHHHTRVGLIALLEEGKRSGDLPSSRFTFVKKYDRTLFICFSMLGRKVAWAESSGCHAHYELEKSLKKRLPICETTAAIDALAETIGADLSTVREDLAKHHA